MLLGVKVEHDDEVLGEEALVAEHSGLEHDVDTEAASGGRGHGGG